MEETTVLPFIIINTKCPKNINFQKLSCFFTGTAQEFKKKFETPELCWNSRVPEKTNKL
jgi:hypothetical protein